MRGALFVAVLLFVGLSDRAVASASLPPFELVHKSVAQARAAQKTARLDLRVTEMAGDLVEWRLRGELAFGTVPEQMRVGASLARRLLWIATLAADPVHEIQKAHGFVNEKSATVGVQQEFVYVYGAMPAVSVFRDLRHIAAFSVKVDGATWVARLTYADDELRGVMITRDGRTVLTARSD